MLTVRLNKRAVLEEVLEGTESGSVQNFIVKPDSTNSLDKIVAYASILQNAGKQVFIEVQFQSQFTPRPKRIEIVEQSSDLFHFYKFSSSGKFDKDAIALDKTKSELEDLHPLFKGRLVGYILLPGESNVEFINGSIIEMGLNIKAKLY